mgnify:CR=1 FL=1
MEVLGKLAGMCFCFAYACARGRNASFMQQKRCLRFVDTALDDAQLSARMLLQVHDELIFEAVDAEVDRTMKVVRHVMEKAPEPAVHLSVPLQVDARAAQNGEEAH